MENVVRPLLEQENQLLAPLFFVIISLLTGAIIKSVLHKSSFPYTVGLFCFGILLGVLCRTGVFDDTGLLKASVDSVGNISPDLILYIFLPILIFDAAYELDVHIFRKTLLNASILAVPGVIVTMLLTACCVMGITHLFPGFEAWNWTYALMFGALISATDPVAVVALLKELGTSKRFSTLVDTESLLNDGTGIVLFMLFFATFSPHQPLFESLPLQFCSVVTGGILVGILIATLIIWFLRHVHGDALVQTSAILLATYVTFFIAEGCMHVSGVIALVAFGLTLSYYGRHMLKESVNKFMEKFWELAAYIANTLIFILVGVVIAMRVDITLTGLLALVIVYVGVNVIRLAVIFLFYPLMKRCGYGLSVRESIILGWGGLRGAVGLTLALMVSATLPIPEEVRKQILFLTAGIVTLTLTFNATTIRRMLSLLKLTDKPIAKMMLDNSINSRVASEARKYFERLKNRDMLAGADWKVVETYLPQEVTYPDEMVAPTDMISGMRLRILDRERTLVHELYVNGIISLNAMRRLLYSIDELSDRDGQMPLSARHSIYRVFRGPFYVRWFKDYPQVLKWIDKRLSRWVVNAYDLGRGLLIIEKESEKMLSELSESKMLTDSDKADIVTLSQEIEQNIAQADAHLKQLAQQFPTSFSKALTCKAVRMLLSHRRHNIQNFASKGLIAEGDAEAMLDEVDNSRETIGRGINLLSLLKKVRS